MLLVYDNATNRKKMKLYYKEYRFVSLAFFLQESDNINDIREGLEEKDLRHIIVDMSNFVKDGNYARLYVERLMWVLFNIINELHFCIRKQYCDTFLEWLPDFFDENEINECFIEKETGEGGTDAEKEKAMQIGNYIASKKFTFITLYSL